MEEAVTVALEEFKAPLGGMDSHAVEAEHYLR